MYFWPTLYFTKFIKIYDHLIHL